MLEKIVSGGQTGADAGGLDAAVNNAFPHGGWCPRGRRSDDGPIPERYHLVETASASYIRRTEWNVRDSDATVIFTLAAEPAGGSLATIRFALKHGKPHIHVPRDGGVGNPAGNLREFVARNEVKVLNVAGSSERREPGIHDWVVEIVQQAFFNEVS